MAVITRWSYKRGGRKAGFHCISYFYVILFPLSFIRFTTFSSISFQPPFRHLKVELTITVPKSKNNKEKRRYD